MSDKDIVLSDRQYQKLLSELEHVPHEKIRSFLDGTITSSEEVDRIEAHLFECSECLEEYNRLFDLHSPLKEGFDSYVVRRDSEARRPVLTAALELLAGQYTQLSDALKRWRDELIVGVNQTGATLEAVFHGKVALDAIAGLSSSRLTTLVSPGGYSTVRRIDTGDGEEKQSSVSMQIQTADITAEVKVSGSSVTLEFDAKPDSSPPFIVLIAEDNPVDVRLIAANRAESDGPYIAHVENLEGRTYLIAINSIP